MKILVAPDKMKGSLTAIEIADIFTMQVSFIYPDWQVISTPLADGGDGSLEIMKRKLPLSTSVEIGTYNAIMTPIKSEYLLDQNEAYVELAKQSGLAQLKLWEQNPMLANTYGTGLVMKDAIDRGAKVIHLFVGGSATHDLGLGILSGLGFRFFDFRGEEFIPAGGTLNKIDRWEANESLKDVTFNLYCDVDNPALGESGAAYYFACQKGANESEIETLENQTENFIQRLERYATQPLNVEMDGASGAIPIGLKALLNAKTFSGIDYFLEIFDVDSEVKWSDLVVSAEGKIDKTSLHNKTVSGVGRLCKKDSKPLYLFCGSSTLNEKDLSDLQVQKIWELRSTDMSLDEAKLEAKSLLCARIKDFLQFIHSEQTVS